MKSVLKALTLVIAFTISGLIKPVISNAVISQEEDRKVVFLGDRHFDRAGKLTGPVQRQQLLENAKLINENAKTKQDEVLFIVEDNLFYNGDNENTKTFIEETSKLTRENLKANELDVDCDEHDSEDIEITKGSVLENIANDCINMGIDVYNAECRQMKYASKVDGSVTGKEVAQESKRIIAQIMSDLETVKNDAQTDDAAQIVYEECTKTLDLAKESTKAVMAILESSDLSVKELIEEQAIENPKETMGFYDMYLVDALILLAWYKNRDRKHCFIVAGSCHLVRILAILEKLGRTTVKFGKTFPNGDEGTIAMIRNRIRFNEFFKSDYPTLNRFSSKTSIAEIV